MKRTKVLFIFLVVGLIALTPTFFVKAHSGHEFSAWALVTPVIDGIISLGEWDDSDSLTVNITRPDGTHTLTIYVKNDSTYLYLAVRVDDEYSSSPGLDFLNFYFDNENNGTTEVGEDGLAIRYEGGAILDTFNPTGELPWSYSDINYGGTNDIVGAITHTNPVPDGWGFYTAEYMHPLDSADDDHDFSLSIGDTVGFKFVLADGEDPSGHFSWPSAVPSGYADIVIAEDGGRTIRVPSDYSTIQAAIDVALDGDTVLVADGIYTGPGNKNLDFLGKAITVKSENGPEHCIIDCEGSGRGFYFREGEGNDSLLQGFTIRNGYFGEEWDRDDAMGAGIFCNGSSPTISNCVIKDNRTYWDGGGIGCYYASPAIIKCTIDGNEASVGQDPWEWLGSLGGGIYLENSSAHIMECTISNNSVNIGAGGGIAGNYSSNAIINNCIIKENYCDWIGGGIYLGYSDSTIINCAIYKNTTGPEQGCGGGIYVGVSSPTITNCTIYGNTSLTGGGLYLWGLYPTITNCTIYGNIALYEGGGIFGSALSNRNCIFWNNSPDEMWYWDGKYCGSTKYTNIKGGCEGEGNIDTDPLFVDVSDPDPANWDLHLRPDSPCIEAGTNDVELPETDYEGDTRIIDGDGSGTATVDMGADECVNGFTPIGDDMTLRLSDVLIVIFENVFRRGYTSVATSADNPASGQEGIVFLGPYHNINTTASYAGEITIALNYDEADIPANKNEEELRIFHLEGTTWVDIPTTIDVNQNIITGYVLSLSWFAIGVPNQAPIANAGDDQLDVSVESDCMASVTLGGSQSSDPDGDPLTYSWTWDSDSASGVSPTIQLPLGTHTITLTVDDGKGGIDSDTVTITVIDNIPPEINVSVSPTILRPPNHKMFLITPTITVSDNCDPNPVVVLTSITMNEGEETNTYDPNYDSTVGDGHTLNDIQIDENGDIYLRAERSGTGTGRIYTIIYTVTDASGNSATASATVTVPHDQK